MARIVIELTNSCNLSCGHCFDERHAATGDLSLDVLDNLLREGKSCGIDQLSFTGGEPTLHRRFRDIVDRVSEAGYSLVLSAMEQLSQRFIPCCTSTAARFWELPSAWMGHEKKLMTGCAAKAHTGA